MLYAGLLAFTPRRPGDLKNFGEWWTSLKDANWRHPYGPKLNINHSTTNRLCTSLTPMRWAGKELPTEAE
jgi:hypothetical protein